MFVSKVAHDRWRHPMETFSAFLAICAGNSPVIGEFSTQRPVTRSFDVFFDLRLNKRLSKKPAGDLRHYCVHCDVTVMISIAVTLITLFRAYFCCCLVFSEISRLPIYSRWSDKLLNIMEEEMVTCFYEDFFYRISDQWVWKTALQIW